ncbi:MAG: hypothetical protein ACLUAR_05215 [Pilosibacter sp.]
MLSYYKQKENREKCSEVGAEKLADDLVPWSEKAAGEYSKTKEEQLRFAFPSYHYEGNFSGKQVVELKGAYYELASWLNCNYVYGIQVFHHLLFIAFYIIFLLLIVRQQIILPADCKLSAN